MGEANPFPAEAAISDKRRLRGPLIAFFALILIFCNLGSITVAGISFYQQRISPVLGIHCSYAHAMNAESCSAFTKRTIAERGIFRGLPLAMQRFRACARTGKGDLP